MHQHFLWQTYSNFAICLNCDWIRKRFYICSLTKNLWLVFIVHVAQVWSRSVSLFLEEHPSIARPNGNFNSTESLGTPVSSCHNVHYLVHDHTFHLPWICKLSKRNRTRPWIMLTSSIWDLENGNLHGSRVHIRLDSSHGPMGTAMSGVRLNMGLSSKFWVTWIPCDPLSVLRIFR